MNLGCCEIHGCSLHHRPQLHGQPLVIGKIRQKHVHTRTNRYGIIVSTRLVFDDLMRMFAAWMQSWLRALSLQVTTVMTCESWQFSFCYLVRHWWVDACFEYIQLFIVLFVSPSASFVFVVHTLRLKLKLLAMHFCYKPMRSTFLQPKRPPAFGRFH